MKYKKFALLALAAGMIVGCGEGPSAPDWSAEFKTFVKDSFYGLEVPYFGTSELGSFTYEIHKDYGYAEIFGGELESSEPIKTAAKFLEEKGFVDLLEDYREDPQYAEQVKWTYPMEYRFEAEEVGPRYIRIGLTGKLPTATAAAAADEVTEEEPVEEPAEEKRSFYAQVFDPYYYSWFDADSTELISRAFGQKTGEKTYKEDETIAEELIPYSGQATYQSSGTYIPDLDDAIAEVAKNGYLKFWMQDVVRAELDAYAASLKTAEQAWDVYTYEEHELEPGYLGRLYKLVSPSKYFTIDVYFAEGVALFRVAKAPASIPQILKDMEPALFASNEVTAYDFEYFEDTESGESGYQYLELSENAAQPSGESLKSAAAAYSALVADEDLNATEVVEFGILSAAEGQGVLDIQDKEVVVYADYKKSSLSTFYFFWGIEVSDWPTYPAELTNEFIAAAGASNIHQFFEQEDGSFKFGTEAESEAAVASVFNAIKSLEGAEVLTDYADGIGRVKVSDTKMAVIELISETETSETGEEVTYYGYSVTLTDIPTFEKILTIVAPAVPGCTEFDFVETTEKGSYYFVAPTEDQTIGQTIFDNLLALSSEEVEVNTLVPYAFEEGEGLGRVQVTDKQVSVMVYSSEGQMYYQVDIGELPVFPDAVNAVATALGLSSVYQFQYYADYKEYIYFPAGVPEDFGAAAEACFNKLAAIAGVEVLEPFSYTPETKSADAKMTGDLYLGDNLHVYLDFASSGNFCVCIGNYYKEPAEEHPYTLWVSKALGDEADVFEWDSSTGRYSVTAEEFGPTEDTLEAATEYFATLSQTILGAAEFADETFVESDINTIPQAYSAYGLEWNDFEISYESENYIVTIYIDGLYPSVGYGEADVTISIQSK